VVLVDEDQQSLAIGKRGQNVRLASRLCGWEIDIKTRNEYFGDEDPEAAAAVDEDRTSLDAEAPMDLPPTAPVAASDADPTEPSPEDA
ncbi:MAG: hypothetical protein P1U53_18780, partial [Sulfitobacter sp.]|nr:hypothetical protein [Sulfitobacter sp.]